MRQVSTFILCLAVVTLLHGAPWYWPVGLLALGLLIRPGMPLAILVAAVGLSLT